MSYSDYLNAQKRHVRCVVCGHGFAAEFDEQLNAHTVFHPMFDERFECERRFYKALLIIYAYIHRSHISVSINTLLTKFDWRTTIVMKKDFLIWCMARGYLATDKLNRILVPEPINETCREIFNSVDLNNSESLSAAIDLLMAALKYLRNELKCVSDDDMPIIAQDATQNETDANRSTKPIDLETTKGKSEAKRWGMATAERTGAKNYGARQTSTRTSIQRKRA